MSSKAIKIFSLIKKGNKSIEEILIKRRTRRCFQNKKITLKEISQIIFSAQGITFSKNKIKKRTAPSAGAIYPLILYISLVNTEIEDGIYKCEEKKITQIVKGDKRKDILLSSPKQIWIKNAPITIMICADFDKIRKKYQKMGISFAFIEAGHIAQNVLLQSESFQMGGVCIGGFDKNNIKNILKIKEIPIYLISLGKVSKKYDFKKEWSMLKKIFNKN
jgi:SagB-type dehydrogenase family enzyme